MNILETFNLIQQIKERQDSEVISESYKNYYEEQASSSELIKNLLYIFDPNDKNYKFSYSVWARKMLGVQFIGGQTNKFHRVDFIQGTADVYGIGNVKTPVDNKGFNEFN